MKKVIFTVFFLLIMFLPPLDEAYPFKVKDGSAGPSPAPQASLGTTVQTEVDTVIQIKDNILYTPTKRYNLSKVKVVNSPGPNLKPSAKMHSVQLIYTNNVLTKVVF
jgi:hypothetical protein